MANQVILNGNLASDARINKTANGDDVANLRIYTHDRIYDSAQKKWVEESITHTVVVFGPTVAYVKKYGLKGASTFVTGKIRKNQWTDKDGVRHNDAEVLISGRVGSIEFQPVRRQPQQSDQERPNPSPEQSRPSQAESSHRPNSNVGNDEEAYQSSFTGN